MMKFGEKYRKIVISKYSKKIKREISKMQEMKNS